MFLSAEKYWQCKTKCDSDTVSDSVSHIGHIRDCFVLAPQVDNTLRSVLNLIYIGLMSGFLIAFIYSGNWKATDNSRPVVKRLDEEIALCQSWINWSLRRALNTLWNCPTSSGFDQMLPKPFEHNKYCILCNQLWFTSPFNSKHRFNNTFLVPLRKRNQYFTQSAHALCNNGKRANSPYNILLLAYLLIFSVLVINEVCTFSIAFS